MSCYRDVDGDWLEDQHAHECDDLTCRGCIPCTKDDDGTPARHCPACNRRATHLSPGQQVCPRCVGHLRDALGEIENLCSLMPGEAEERGVDSEAAVLAGPAADVEAWGYRHASAVLGRKDHVSLLEPTDPNHPLTVLGWWVMALCEDFGHDRPERFTVTGSVSYLSRNLSEYAADPHQDFVSLKGEVLSCRAHLENVLREGVRAERTRVPCLDCGTRLVRRWADAAKDDHHLCPNPACGRRRYDAGEFARAKADWLNSDGADRMVILADAVSAIGRPEFTVRTWMRRGEVRAACDVRTHRLMVWWPDVRDTHRERQVRDVRRRAG